MRSSPAPGILVGMDSEAYGAFEAVREEFRGLVRRWSEDNPYLREAQERLRVRQGYEDYHIETPIVYNHALDEVRPEAQIKVILVADNPGKKEQLGANNRYLVGQSGKLAESWFRRELGIDFRLEVLVLNKTPVHTAKTAELGMLARSAGPGRLRLESLLAESQAAMAGLAWRLHRGLRSSAAIGAEWPVLWISGLGELRRGGLFEIYRDELGRGIAQAAQGERACVWAFNHFSMNQFAIEVKRKARPGAPIAEELARIGRENRARVFGL